VDENWYIVDLPGYGFAKRSKSEREKWEKMIKNYIIKRENLMTLFLLVDLRLEPQAIDLEFIGRLGDSLIPFVIVFTKADKLAISQAHKNLALYKKTLLKEWEDLPLMIVTSAKDASGKEEMLEYIEKTNQLFVKQ
jgi:GTP-binding protein